MDYQKHYDLLIKRARDRIIDEYTEKHHILPRCMNGDNTKANIVRLTPEEHYVAHQLLTKIYPNNYKLVYAVLMMTYKSHKRSNKIYGWIRRKAAIAQSNKIVSMETKQKIGLSKVGKHYSLGLKRSEETRLKISLSKKGKQAPNKGVLMSEDQKEKLRKPKSEEHKQKLSEANLKSETRKRLSEINKGRIRTEEQKRKQSEIMKGRPSHRKGDILSEETKTKLSLIQKSRFGNNLPLGINFDIKNQKYRARYQTKHIGRYKTLDEAIVAVNMYKGKQNEKNI